VNSHYRDVLDDCGDVIRSTFNKFCDSWEEAFLILINALLAFEGFQRGTNIGSQIVTDRSKRPAEIVMPVWASGKDNIITVQCRSEFPSKALFWKGNLPAGLECEGHFPDKDQLILVRHARIDGTDHGPGISRAICLPIPVAFCRCSSLGMG
jgi:hypothetical protein